MAYLTYSEFQALPFADPSIAEADFDKYEWFAEQVINELTMSFYEYHDLATDTDTFRVTKFKQAVALQTINQFESETLTQDQAENEAQSITMGRTSINYGSTPISNGGSSDGYISADAYRQLVPTGLLYRGV
ncbi:hypothetical protein Nizo2814_1808 [Lactiplantibacillus plantarum]|uniref:hypothetical protein n=1 Tax=Lactiplantibacillus plantarum TaxID=1590 RepID=UPI0007B55ED6|nr:hypothetical protein [Lactiplantibacillus plantarum]KZU62679.1 hypothetical protein Nizo2814_1808 [Lactiplantibacillus plantarum]